MNRRVIRFSPDYGNPWPLWERNAALPDPLPSDLGLSESLQTQMRNWYDFWEVHFHWERGWDSEENETLSWLEGNVLVEKLRTEIADFADVSDGRPPHPNSS